MIKIGFVASHGGSGMQAILQAIHSGLNANPRVLICNNQNAQAFNVARQYHLDCYYLSFNTHDDLQQLDREICTTLKGFEIDLLLLSGYMKKLGPETLSAFNNRILNIHPALLPKFGGQGMYGDRVHQTVLNNRESVSGASVHIVTAEYDQGPVLNQEIVTVDADETLESLREKVKNIEGQLYVDTLAGIISGAIPLPG